MENHSGKREDRRGERVTGVKHLLYLRLPYCSKITRERIRKKKQMVMLMKQLSASLEVKLALQIFFKYVEAHGTSISKRQE